MHGERTGAEAVHATLAADPEDGAGPAGTLAALLALIRAQGLRLPDRTGTEVDDVHVDLVYETGPVKSAILLDYTHGDPGGRAMSFHACPSRWKRAGMSGGT